MSKDAPNIIYGCNSCAELSKRLTHILNKLGGLEKTYQHIKDRGECDMRLVMYHLAALRKEIEG